MVMGVRPLRIWVLVYFLLSVRSAENKQFHFSRMLRTDVCKLFYNVHTNLTLNECLQLCQRDPCDAFTSIEKECTIYKYARLDPYCSAEPFDVWERMGPC